MAALSKKEIHEKLKEFPGWSHEGKCIRRKYTLPSFVLAIALVNKIAAAAEKAGHHPDLTVNYNVVGIALSTHSEGGVTAKDFDLARQIDLLADNPS
jgi:4a-hydroxytetrahydrobiopterin dehydratase